jgi:hypothetical protein
MAFPGGRQGDMTVNIGVTKMFRGFNIIEEITVFPQFFHYVRNNKSKDKQMVEAYKNAINKIISEDAGIIAASPMDVPNIKN